MKRCAFAANVVRRQKVVRRRGVLAPRIWDESHGRGYASKDAWRCRTPSQRSICGDARYRGANHEWHLAAASVETGHPWQYDMSEVLQTRKRTSVQSAGYAWAAVGICVHTCAYLVRLLSLNAHQSLHHPAQCVPAPSSEQAAHAPHMEAIPHLCNNPTLIHSVTVDGAALSQCASRLACRTQISRGRASRVGLAQLMSHV